MQQTFPHDASFDLAPKALSTRLAFTISIPADVKRIQPVVRGITDRLEPLGYPRAIMELDIPLAITEAMANAIAHGSRFDASKQVVVAIRASRKVFHCTVADEGPGFDYHNVGNLPDTGDEPLTHGRGVLLIRSLMSEVKFNPAGNQIKMLLALARPAGRQLEE